MAIVIFLTIVDDYSRFTWTHLMHTKVETRQIIMEFIAYIEMQFNSKVKIIRSDNGPEFLMHSFYALKGIIHQTSCVETLEQNGIVERKHQHLLNVTHAFLFQANLQHKFWCFALPHVAYLINYIPTTFLHNVSPYEKLYGHPCDISNLRVFGCLCYINTLNTHRHKLDPRDYPCVFIGFKPHTKGYLIYDLHSHNITSSRNITFYEDHFPSFHETQASHTSPSSPSPTPFSSNHEHFVPSIETTSPSPTTHESSATTRPHTYDALHEPNMHPHTSKTTIVISLHSLLPPQRTFGILSTQFYLTLVFLLRIVISPCLFLCLPNLPLMLKLPVMTVGLRRCKLSYKLFN